LNYYGALFAKVEISPDMLNSSFSVFYGAVEATNDDLQAALPRKR
jgi:hypothetical protein